MPDTVVREPESQEGDSPVPAGYFDPALNVTSMKQAAKLVKDGQRAVTEAAELKRQLEEKDAELERSRKEPEPEPEPQGQPQNQGWDLNRGRQAFVQDLNVDPLSAVDSVAQLRARQTEDRLQKRLDKMEAAMTDRAVSDAWGDFTQQLADIYDEKFVSAQKDELQKQMRRYGSKPPDMELFRHFASLEKAGRQTKEPQPEPVEGATSVPAAGGVNKFVHSNGKPWSAREMHDFGVQTGQIDPSEIPPST
jgi:hypothetical protein